jgi:hypothetical protein
MRCWKVAVATARQRFPYRILMEKTQRHTIQQHYLHSGCLSFGETPPKSEIAALSRCGGTRAIHGQPKRLGKVILTPWQRKRNTTLSEMGKVNDWRGILELFHKERDGFCLVNLSTALAQLKRRSSRSLLINNPKGDDHLREMFVTVADYIDHAKVVDTRSYSSIVHSIATMDVRHDATWRIVQHLAERHFMQQLVATGGARAIASAAWSLAKLKLPDLMEILLREINEETVLLLFQGKESNPQSIANMAWACAKLGCSAPVLFDAIERHGVWLVSTATDVQVVANTAWACAKLSHASPTLFEAIDNRSEWLVSKGIPQTISSTAWACGKLGHPLPAFFDAVDQRGDWLVSNGTPQQVANTAWACAKLGQTSPGLFSAIDRHAEYLVATTTTATRTTATTTTTTTTTITTINNNQPAATTTATTNTIDNTAARSSAKLPYRPRRRIGHAVVSATGRRSPAVVSVTPSPRPR